MCGCTTTGTSIIQSCVTQLNALWYFVIHVI